MATVKYPEDLLKPKLFKEAFLDTLLEEGYAVIQYIDGEKFIKMTGLYFEELGDYIKKNPNQICKEYWEDAIKRTKNGSVMDFIKQLYEAHKIIKKITDNEVDFWEIIGDELDE